MRLREKGRVLFLGVGPDGKVISFVVGLNTPEAIVLSENTNKLPASGVFIDLQSLQQTDPNNLRSVTQYKVGSLNFSRHVNLSSRQMLKNALRNIHSKGWIQSQ